MAFGAAKAHAVDASNVVALNAPQHRQSLPRRLAAHAALFTTGRRAFGDVFWLKENAEFLNILAATGHSTDEVLERYGPLYDRVCNLMGEFPQYYRFHLSLCLDLEDLGMPGDKGAVLCDWVATQGLAEAELSDLQRAEARRLLARRGVEIGDERLTERLHAFADRTRTFAIPNIKAAYELTHIVFYLSDYGRRDPGMRPSAIRSLIHAGLLAFLNQDHDLLAEICIALRYAGRQPSREWEDCVMAALRTAEAQDAPCHGSTDDSHSYLVGSWLAGLKGRDVIPLRLQPNDRCIFMAPPIARPLREMSTAISELRNGDWHAVRGRVAARLDGPALRILEAAETSTDEFADFYEIFARTARPTP